MLCTGPATWIVLSRSGMQKASLSSAALRPFRQPLWSPRNERQITRAILDTRSRVSEVPVRMAASSIDILSLHLPPNWHREIQDSFGNAAELLSSEFWVDR